VAQPVDSSILHEIVRVVELRRKVPERVQVRAREYLITYLEDHQRRLEEALQRYDSDRLNMLYGQLASKIKYQLLRRLPGGGAAATRKQAKEKPKAPLKQKAKPKPKSKTKPKPKTKPKAKSTAKRSSKTSRATGARARSKPAKIKTLRGKTRKPTKRVAARKTASARGVKRGSKRKPPKK
jgi:hypothetical protein